MAVDSTSTGTMPEASMERMPTTFSPTPEAIHELLVDRDIDTIKQQILEGEKLEELAQEVAQAIIEKRVNYQESFPNIDWDNDVDGKLEEKLRTLLLAQLEQEQMRLQDDAKELIYKAERLEAIEKDPEKKGLFTRALDKIRNLGWKGKILVALVVVALAAGAIAGGFYLAGQWEGLMSYVGAAAEAGSADAAGAMDILEEAGKLGEYGAEIPSDWGR